MSAALHQQRNILRCFFPCNCLSRANINIERRGWVISSVKWSDPGHFLESQGKFFLSFPCTLFLDILLWMRV